jgi:putative spermidine/putrescine transport system substrate-binding protein
MRNRSLIFGAVVALVVVACGGGGGATTRPSTGGTAPPAATPTRAPATSTAAAATQTAAAASSTPAAASATPAGATTVPSTTLPLPSGLPTSIGEGEGVVTMLNWAGYVEDGSTDEAYDWVTPFEEDTGCDVQAQTFGTSDEAFSLFTTQPDQFDLISASGDASKRLAAAGFVQPVNVDLVPNYKDIYSSLKDQPYNTFDGVHYGIPHGRGANQLMWHKDTTEDQTRWDQEMFNPTTTKRLSVYDAPIYIADAAIELMDTHPELGITNPYALDETQFAAAIDLLEAQRPHITQYWTDYTAQQAAFENGDVDVATTWNVIYSILTEVDDPPIPVGITNPEEGATAWSDTWMLNSRTKHINCAYMWLDYVASPQTQADIVGYYGEAPANSKACDILGKDFCAFYHAGDNDPFWDTAFYWQTPEAQCVDGRTDVQCKDFDAWKNAWLELKG